jgi:site-specific DNA recombinase
MRVACYARYSSDLQRETSIEDQLAVAKRYAEDRGSKVLQDHIYTDAAVSGASINGRAGVQRLLSAAAERPKPFDVLLVDDSSRISRDIPDAIRVQQQLKFHGIRVIYVSQGIDSESDQSDAMVAVHGVIDSFYLKELAKKTKRGLAGQLQRGFATGAKTYGYRTVPVPDPTGKLDVDGHPVLLGKRIEVDETQAEVIRRIFEWVAQGVGRSTIVKRLNAEGIPGTRGRRWSKGALQTLVINERYLGRQVWGQQSVEHEPGTGRRIMRDNPRDKWFVVDRPDLRIVSDELWQRAQSTMADVRAIVAPNRELARGKSGKYHSKHLFAGFARCSVCGGTMSSVTGGHGSPRFGCRRSWQEGHACPNRLTIRIKVAEPQILAKLQGELLKPATLDYITKAVEREAKKALAGTPNDVGALRKQLEQEKRKLQNLVSALEGGSSAPAALVKAVSEREMAIAQLESQIRSAATPAPVRKLDDASEWVRKQLGDLAGLLRSDVPKVKAEFRRLNPSHLHPHRRVTASPLRCQRPVRLERTGLFFCPAFGSVGGARLRRQLRAKTPSIRLLGCESGLDEGESGPQPHPSFIEGSSRRSGSVSGKPFTRLGSSGPLGKSVCAKNWSPAHVTSSPSNRSNRSPSR